MTITLQAKLPRPHTLPKKRIMSFVTEIPLVNNDDEEMKEHSSVGGYSNEMSSSAAQALVQTAAYRIDLNPSKLGIFLHAMDAELVTEMWQLQFMDFPSWREMGFPVGLIASIRAVLEEEEEVESEEVESKQDTYRNAIRSDSPTTELVVPKASFRPRMNRSEAGTHDKEVKRRVSDITLSERFSFRSAMLSPPARKTRFGSTSPKHLTFQSERRNLDRSARMHMREASVKSFLTDTPPISAPRRSSSRSKKARSPRQPLRDPVEKQKLARRSSITMPLCPSRRPTFTDLESLVQSIEDPSTIGESFTVVGSADEGSFALEGSTRSRATASEDKMNPEKSMATIVTGNLCGTGDHCDFYIGDEHDNASNQNGEGLTDSGDSFMPASRRYTIR